MIAYFDSSVILRVVLEQEGQLAEWHDVTHGISSQLLPVECHRSLDRLWQQNRIAEDQLALKSAAMRQLISRLELQPLSENVLAIASQPFPSPLGTLDALHLATAMIFRSSQPTDERPILFATHDIELAKAAAVMHFDVIGASL